MSLQTQTSLTDEDIILGQVLRDNDVYFKAKLKENYFTRPEAKRLFSAISSCFQSGVSADMRSAIDKGASPGYTASTTDYPSTANWKYFADRIRKKAQLSALRGLAAELGEKTGDPEEIMSWIDSRLLDLSQASDEDKIVKVSETLIEYVSTLEARFNMKGSLPGLESGIGGLDKKTLGFQPSRLYYIGARPSQGKSALMITMALNIISKGRRVGIISIESSCQEILDRLFAQKTGISSELLITGYLGNADMEKIQDAAGYFQGVGLYIYDSPNCDITTLRSRAKRMVAVNKVEILFIDYLQIIEHSDRDVPFREKIAAISKTLKQVARETRVPVVCCAQLRRDAEERRPILSDFSESSQIEKDADVAVLIWHQTEDEGEKSWLLVEKNRDGAKGMVPVYFRRNIYRFDDRGRE